MRNEAKQDYVATLMIEDDQEEREVDLRNLSELCIELGELDEAEKFLEMAKEIVGESFDVKAIQRDLERARAKMQSGNL
jgi:hypothetical protein